MGRTPLPPHEKRSHRVGLYLNEAELDDLERKVGIPGLAELVRVHSKRRCGMREISDLLRSKLLRHRVPTRICVPELNETTAADLGRVGSNVNQIAHFLNLAALTGEETVQVAAIVADLQKLRDALEDALLGLAGASMPGATTPAVAIAEPGWDFFGGVRT